VFRTPQFIPFPLKTGKHSYSGHPIVLKTGQLLAVIFRTSFHPITPENRTPLKQEQLF
jgi:hypothetical protein